MSEEVENTLGHNWTHLEVRDFVARCYDRDALLTTLLGYGSQWLEGRLICVVAKSRIQPFMSKGWDSWGSDEETTAEMSEIQLELEVESTMSIIIAEGIYTLGTPDELGLTPLFENASVLTPEQLIVIPLQLGSRTKMLLVGEPKVLFEDMERFSDELESLIEAASEITAQLEEIIKLAKMGKLPPETERIPSLPKSVQERLFRDETRRDRIRKERELSEMLPAEPTSEGEADDIMGAFEEDFIAAISQALEHSEPEVPFAERPLSRSILDNAFEAREATDPRKRSTAMLSAPVSESLVEDSEERRKTIRLEPVQRETQGTQQHPVFSAAQENVGVTATGSPSQVISTAEDVEEAPVEEETNTGTTDHGIQPPFRATGPMEVVSSPEEEGVAIIAPIGIAAEGSESKRTLMGGFSIEDIRRAQELYRSHGNQIPLDIINPPKPIVEAPVASPPPKSAPKALILKRRRKKQRRAPEPAKVEAEQRASSDESPPLMSKATQLIHSVTSEPESFATTQVIHPTHKPNAETPPIPHLETGPALPAPSAETLKMKSVDVAIAQDMDAPAQDILLMLDSRDQEVAFEAADEVSRFPKLLDTLEEMFPGRLFVDRYMHQFGATLPPVQEHGPVLRAMSRMGPAILPTVGRLLHSGSLDARFYATFLLTELQAPDLLDALRERLFDRDAQTRSVAFRVVIAHQGAPNFEEAILAPMRNTVQNERDDLRVEYAAELLGEVRDAESVRLLIETIERHRLRTSRVIHKALQQITLQPLPAAMIAWRQWHDQSLHETREEWVLRALNANSKLLREMVAREIESYEGLNLHYHPDQPPSLRVRAQQQLKEWFDKQD